MSTQVERDLVLKEFREKFHQMKRVERELFVQDLVKGLHSLSGAFVNAMANDTFMTIVSEHMDTTINSPIFDDFIKLMEYLQYPAILAKSDMQDAKEIDFNVTILERIIANSFQHVRATVNKVMLNKVNDMNNNPIKDVEGNVIHVEFNNTKKG